MGYSRTRHSCSTVLDGDRILERDERVLHASNVEHAARHCNEPARILRHGITCGGDVWEQRAGLFPGLTFCESAKDNLNALSKNDPILFQMIKHLTALSDVAPTLVSNQLTKLTLGENVSGESDQTMQRYAAERTFSCPDGVQRTFSLHGRITPQAWRYYIWNERVNGKILIGYIGPKLATVSDPT